jgi:hypothetical protein
MTTDTEVYDIYDYLEAGFELQPLECIHCGHVGEVVINSRVADGYCQMCGEWQLGDES